MPSGERGWGKLRGAVQAAAHASDPGRGDQAVEGASDGVDAAAASGAAECRRDITRAYVDVADFSEVVQDLFGQLAVLPLPIGLVGGLRRRAVALRHDRGFRILGGASAG